MDYSKKKTVEDIDVAGKKVLVRCDFNVPLDENGNITDTKRIDEAMKTINYLVSHNAKVILCSHLGLSLIHIYKYPFYTGIPHRKAPGTFPGKGTRRAGQARRNHGSPKKSGAEALSRLTSPHGGCPVSYTHLDVYKRQAPGRWKTRPRRNMPIPRFNLPRP